MQNDIDPIETQEWLESLESVIKNEGEERASFLIQQLMDRANGTGIQLPAAITTPFRNTIPVTGERKAYAR